MNTSTRTHRISQTVTALTIAMVTLTGFAGAAFAAPAVVTVPLDPTGGAMDTAQSAIQTWVTTIGIPVLFGLLLLGVLIRLGTKWFRKAAKAV
jgi:hypothetical protein